MLLVRKTKAGIVATFLLCSLAACEPGVFPPSGNDNGNGECVFNVDCADDEVCLNGECTPQEPSGCDWDGDCAAGQMCVDAECIDDRPSGCTSNAECAGQATCVDGECVADTIRLTTDPARDTWPSWDPASNMIAFVTDRAPSEAPASNLAGGPCPWDMGEAMTGDRLRGCSGPR